MDCIFCKIIEGVVPSYTIYEDDLVIAILDRQPVRQGHAMVIPKKHIDHFIDLPEDLAAHIAKIGNVIGQKIQKELKPKRVGFAVAGFSVPHAHYHIIPMWEEHDVTSSQYIEGHARFSMDHVPVADPDTQGKLAEILRLAD